MKGRIMCDRGSQTWKSEMGQRTVHPASDASSDRVRRAGPQARVDPNELRNLGRVKAMVQAKQRPLLHPGMAA
jgi:hypothetical protein